MARVLLVDDDPDITFAISTLLKREKIAVFTHNSGFGLLNAVRKHRPDLVVLDLSMPGLSGEAALSVLRDVGSSYYLNTRVVFYSGHPNEILEQAAARCGADGFISKSQSAPEVVAKIRNFLDATPTAADKRRVAQ